MRLRASVLPGATALVMLFLGGGCDTRWGLVDAPSVARLVNDLPFSVRVTLCNSSDCTTFYPPDERLDPDETWAVNVSSVGVPAVYAVRLPSSGRILGCLPLVTPFRRVELRVAASELVPCKKDVDDDVFWPARWESLTAPS